MSNLQRFIIRSVLVVFLLAILVRLAPLVARMIQASVSGIRGYAWAVIPTLLISWIIWKVIRRRGNLKKPELMQD